MSYETEHKWEGIAAVESKLNAMNCQQPSEAAVGISELLACRQFEEEDREAIGRVTMLLTEYAWSNDHMSDNAKKLKAAMLKVWEHWQARQANTKLSDGR